jgi:hypothetical protein
MCQPNKAQTDKLSDGLPVWCPIKDHNIVSFVHLHAVLRKLHPRVQSSSELVRADYEESRAARRGRKTANGFYTMLVRSFILPQGQGGREKGGKKRKEKEEKKENYTPSQGPTLKVAIGPFLRILNPPFCVLSGYGDSGQLFLHESNDHSIHGRK